MPPTSGILPFTQEVLGTTLATNAAYVVNPTNASTLEGTPQSNAGNNAYALGYGADAISMAIPRVMPVTNTYGVVGGTAPASLSLSASTVFGAAQGNCLSPSGKVDAQIPEGFVKLYQQILNHAAYVPARI
jgi:hypothetical protein